MRAPGSFNQDAAEASRSLPQRLHKSLWQLLATLSCGVTARAVRGSFSAAMRSSSRTARSSTSRQKDFYDIDPKILFNQRQLPPWREMVHNILHSSRYESCTGIIIVLNLVFIVLETDHRSTIDAGTEKAGSEAVEMSTQSLNQLRWIRLVFLALYSVEILIRLWATRKEFFTCPWNCLDFVVVSADSIAEIIHISGAHGVSFLRVLRMIRLFRLARTLIAFRELYTLISGLAQCCRTLLWAALLILLTLTVCSIVAVEYVHPLMHEVELTGTWDITCTWCPTAFRSVMESNLTFFQIVSGDGWSSLARPLIEKHPWTVFLFIAIIFLVLFGMLNLIVAAIVDTASRAREKDLDIIAQDRREERKSAWDDFLNLCFELDTDQSGSIGLDELKKGMATNKNLQNHFSVMDVEEDDIAEVFRLLDEDDSGDLTYKEFHHQLYKMKTMEVRTTLFYVVRYVQFIQKQLARQDESFKVVMSQMNRLAKAQREAHAPRPVATQGLPSPTPEASGDGGIRLCSKEPNGTSDPNDNVARLANDWVPLASGCPVRDGSAVPTSIATTLAIAEATAAVEAAEATVAVEAAEVMVSLHWTDGDVMQEKAELWHQVPSAFPCPSSPPGIHRNYGPVELMLGRTVDDVSPDNAASIANVSVVCSSAAGATKLPNGTITAAVSKRCDEESAPDSLAV